MFNISEVFEKYNLDDEKYEQLLRDCSDKICGTSELDWSEISEKYGLGFAGDTLRKGMQPPIVGGEFIREYYLNKLEKNKNTENYIYEVESQLRKLEQAKIKFRDERMAWNKQNYNEARLEQKLDYLESTLNEIGRVEFKEFEQPWRNLGKNEMIIVLSDLHIGQTFSSIFGQYDTDIAKERLSKYLDSVKENAELYKVIDAKIVCVGDLISGNIRKSIQITNRENIIEQIKMASEMIASFCYECTQIFNTVTFYNVAGNHTRMDIKEDAIHDERLDSLISWIVNSMLNHINNFKYVQNDIDTGIAIMDVCGKKYVAVHGDYDNMDKNGIGNLSMMLNTIPYAVIRGHNHYPAFNDISGVKVIQSGSLPGSGDQHTIEKRLTGKPSQTIIICNEKGIKAHIPVEL